MDERFSLHNTHHEDASKFAEYDPQLRNLKKQFYVFTSGLIKQIPVNVPGIYSVGGGRQVGKTTMLKQWMKCLIDKGIAPKNITYISGEIIDDHHSLLNTVNSILKEALDQNSLIYIIIDEVTYIKDWDKAIKYLADAGVLYNAVLVITGSDLAMIKEARVRFPGRRGESSQVDFHFFPLSFYEYVKLISPNNDNPTEEQLNDQFQNYLIHGGYLTAINDFHKNGKIGDGVYNTYSDWIRGDVIKHGKSEHFLKEILLSFLVSYGSQVTWNSLSHHISIDHPSTVQSYAQLLASMDAIFIQHAIMEDKLLAAPKKAKKIYFSDIFILHSIIQWLSKSGQKNVEIPQSLLAETTSINHFRRWFATYYIKGISGEVDIAYVKENKFHPIEIKWTTQIRTQDLKQIGKYKDSLVLTKNQNGAIGNIKLEALPKYLFNLGKENKDNYQFLDSNC
jgi:predicted AAA+ superfamily ATPase